MRSYFQYWITFSLPIALISHAFAQSITDSTSQYRITGIVKDSITDNQIEFCSVTLLSNDSLSNVHTFTDSSGIFHLTSLERKDYSIHLQRMGYKRKVIKIHLDTVKSLQIMIPLSPDITMLKEVSVTGIKNKIESNRDRLIYNVDDADIQGNQKLIDILARVPLINIGRDKRLEVLGKKAVIILINGKRTISDANSLMNYLNTLPAKEIKNIEVMTNPSSKYDGENNAGIVNIITKKPIAPQYFGSIGLGAGTRDNNDANVYLSIQTKKISSVINYGFNTYNNIGDYTIHRKMLDTNRQIDQDGDRTNKAFTQAGLFNFSYEVDSLNIISSNFNINSSKNDKSSLSNYSFLSQNTQYAKNNIYALSESKSIGLNLYLDYTRKFKGNDNELVISYLYGNSSNSNTYGVDNLQREGYEYELNVPKSKESTIQIDYNWFLSKKSKIEVGAKTILRNFTTYINDSVSNKSEQLEIIDILRGKSTGLEASQDIYAAYLNYNYSFSSYYILVGSRFEYTNVNGTFYNERKAQIANDHHNFFPSITVSRKLKNDQNVKIQYSRGIMRPGVNLLNPNIVSSYDPNNLIFGNPELQPEFSDNLELSYDVLVKKKSFLYASLYYSEGKEIIQNISQSNGEVLSTSYFNSGRDRSLGLNFSSSISLPKLNIGTSFNVNRYIVKNQLENVSVAENNGYNFTGNFNFNYRLPKGLTLRGIFSIGAPKVILQGRSFNFSYAQFNLNKSILKSRGTLGLELTNPFSFNNRFSQRIGSPNFNQKERYFYKMDHVAINFSYSFGKSFAQKGVDRKIKNTDVKEGQKSMN
ncbi:TonB-dependent receptor [Olivibacter sp. SA151]|uniref:TonB-dependent receptor domain-containing protein n=1 Tax=Olivibacter jilunii TaxID=985016 RepID=UPI003F1462F3